MAESKDAISGVRSRVKVSSQGNVLMWVLSSYTLLKSACFVKKNMQIFKK